MKLGEVIARKHEFEERFEDMKRNAFKEPSLFERILFRLGTMFLSTV